VAWHPHQRSTIAYGKGRQWMMVVGVLHSLCAIGWLVFERFCCPLFIGDELGRVVLKDLQGSQPTVTKTAHSRQVSGLAFSTHR